VTGSIQKMIYVVRWLRSIEVDLELCDSEYLCSDLIVLCFY